MNDTPLFRLVNGKLDVIASEFCSILTSGALDIDSDTLDKVPINGQLALGRLRIGLLLFHFCSFWRRIRQPLLKWRLFESGSELGGPGGPSSGASA